ncbi:MAG: NAD-dependent protein deacylase [Oscillospiraceae bacterium]|jgi:NAD-dependent deacetylase
MYADRLAKIIMESQRIVFFGGAGVSTASGIPDFRSADGIFHQPLNRTCSPEELVSHTFYKKYPAEFFQFYREKLVYPQAKPNPCHIALAQLEKMGKLSAVITQNIDGLHQQAGSKNVIELHGSIHRNYCEECGSFYPLAYILETKEIPRCTKCEGRVKPDVVLYEESLNTDSLEQAIYELTHGDTLIVGGTSLMVYPAAGLLQFFRGTKRVFINKNPSAVDQQADLLICDDIAAIFQSVMGKIRFS